MTKKRIEGEILSMLQQAERGRLRPNALITAIAHGGEFPFAEVKSIMVNLVRRDVLIYTYRDPCSFVELPS